MKELFEILKASKADDFIIRETTTYSQEAFFIQQKLDMSRAKEVTHTVVSVYVDSEDKKLRGSATKQIHPTCTPNEMKKEVDEAIFAAQFVPNPWYPLVTNQTNTNEDHDIDLTEKLVNIVKAIQQVKTQSNEKINSYEVFVNKKITHIVNSKGVDVTFSNMDCEVEVVINVKQNDHEIELLKDMRFADRQSDDITKEIEKMFENGRARLHAKPTSKNEHATVLLSGDDVVEFFQYFTMQTNAQYQYMGVAKAKLNEKMTGNEADALTIKTKKYLEGSTKNTPYDQDGNSIQEKVLFENGVCKNFWGSVQHAHYIQLEDTTSINNVIIHGGSMSEAEMRKKPYVEVTDFSAFVMDPISGNFGGEIRLGYESDGQHVQAISGGSISANMQKVMKNMKFSKETRQINHYIVPCAVLISDVIVAGE